MLLLKKLSGFGLSMTTVLICYFVFSLTFPKKLELNDTITGLTGVSIFAVPFIILGAIISHYICRSISKQGVCLLFHLLLGIAVSFLPIMIFRFYHDSKVTLFLIISGVIGAVSYYVGSVLINKTSWRILLGIAIPIIIIVSILVVSSM